MQANEPRYLAWTLFSCGQFFPAWSSSRKMIGLRVDSGMAGMGLIVPPRGMCAG